MRLGLLIACFCATVGWAGPFPPAAGLPGSTAIPHNDPSIVAWATEVLAFARGPQDASDPASALASFGSPTNALGQAGTSPTISIVSLGDGGRLTLGFATPITDGPGPDFAVFENSFDGFFLELAFVEVSSNGTDFFRFPAISLTPTDIQIDTFDTLDPTDIHNLAGKYKVGFGTPFDLEDLRGTPGLDINAVIAVRLVDTVGSLDPRYATTDSEGQPINDPFPTPFPSGGFDLDAVAVLHEWQPPVVPDYHLDGADQWVDDPHLALVWPVKDQPWLWSPGLGWIYYRHLPFLYSTARSWLVHLRTDTTALYLAQATADTWILFYAYPGQAIPLPPAPDAWVPWMPPP